MIKKMANRVIARIPGRVSFQPGHSSAIPVPSLRFEYLLRLAVPCLAPFIDQISGFGLISIPNSIR